MNGRDLEFLVWAVAALGLIGAIVALGDSYLAQRRESQKVRGYRGAGPRPV